MYHPKFILAAVWKGHLERNVGWEKLEFTILPSKAHNCKFLNRKLLKEKNWRKGGIQNLPSKIYSCSCLKKTFWKECGLRKVGIHNFTIQSSQLQVFEMKTVKGKGTKKSRNPKSSIQIPIFLRFFPFHSFLFKNLQLWALDAKIMKPNFSQPTFLSKCPFQTAARMNFGC